MSEQPDGWITAPLMQIIDLHDSRRVPLNQSERAARRGKYPYYGANGQVDTIDDYLFDGHFILLAEDGGYFDDPARGVAYEATGRFWVNNHAHIISPKADIPVRYLRHFLNQINWMKYVGGTTRLKLTQEGMHKIPVALPPLAEQKRIVSKLDSLLTRSGKARDELAHIPRLIERYKQAILSAAFRGDLTADWKEYKLKDICHTITDGDHQAPPKTTSGIPFITISAINDGKLSLDKATRYVPKNYYDGLASPKKAIVGDILFSVTGSIAIPALVDNDAAFVFQRHIAILKPDTSKVLSKFLYHVLGSAHIKDQSLAVATGSAQLTIPLTALRGFSLKLPSLDEQDKVVQRIERALSIIDAIDADTTDGLRLISLLEAACLSKAFNGKLVTQDPNDEPAAALLARIQSQAAAAPQRKRTGTRA